MSDLVIDADIMRAAGTSEIGTSAQARAVLDQISAGGHRFVQSPAIKVEHDKHRSLYASIWRGRMLGRKLMIYVKPAEDKILHAHLIRAQNPESSRDEMAVSKDIHLLEAAAESDHRIISGDRNALKLFRKGCPLPSPYGQIIWADATDHPSETLEWIKQGCPESPDWQICRARTSNRL